MTVYILSSTGISVANNARTPIDSVLTTSGTSSSPTLNANGSVAINSAGYYLVSYSLAAVGGGSLVWALTVDGTAVVSIKIGNTQSHETTAVILANNGSIIEVTNRSGSTETVSAPDAEGLGNNATLTIVSLPQ